MSSIHFTLRFGELLEQIHPKLGLEVQAGNFVSGILNKILVKIRQTVISSDAEEDDVIGTIIYSFLDYTNSLYRHAFSEAKKSLKKYEIDRKTLLVFDFPLVKDVKHNIIINAVLEYISAELFELGGNVTVYRMETMKEEGDRISKDDIIQAIEKDEDLKKMYDSLDVYIGKIPEAYEVDFTGYFSKFDDSKTRHLLNGMMQHLLQKMRDLTRAHGGLSPYLRGKLEDFIKSLRSNGRGGLVDIISNPSITPRSTRNPLIDKLINDIIAFAAESINRRFKKYLLTQEELLLIIKNSPDLKAFYLAIQ